MIADTVHGKLANLFRGHESAWTELIVNHTTFVFSLATLGGHVYVFYMWQHTRYKDPAVQGLQLMRSAGCILGPLVARPFLSNTNVGVPGHSIEWTTATLSNATASFSNVSDVFQDGGHVYVAYLIVGVVGIIGAILFFILAATEQYCTRKWKPSENRETGDKTYRSLVLTMLFVSYFCFVFMEDNVGFFLTAFVTKGVGWDVRTGPVITSVFYIAHGTGLIIGIFLSAILKPSRMLILTLTMVSVAYVVMGTAGHLQDFILWGTVGLAGMSVSTIFASYFNFASNYIYVDGVVSAVFLVGASAGSMAALPLTAFLMQEYSYWWLVYLAVVACGCSWLIFIILLVYTTLHTKHGTTNSGEDGEQSQIEKDPLKGDACSA